MASAASPADAATKKKEETTRRDRLQQIEAEKQQAWSDAKLYEFDAPKEGEEHQEKFMATFPYPYMNGRLHLGHAFSLSKPEIRTRFEIMQGKRGMFPMGFHVTGMPIAAAANRLKREISEFGNPPVFPKVEASTEPVAGTASAGGNFKGRQLKKAPANKRQWEIMESMKVPDIASFQESLKWLEYFPPLAVDDLRKFGAAIDWRRSFITTEENPFYDAFIKWQFRHLARQGRLAFGKRLAVFSPLEGQPCADHDRSEGEGAVPQEYTLVKLPIIDAENWPAFATHLDKIKGKTVSLVAATLRPETMFGQTNCWILPEGEYGVYPLSETELVVMAQRAANNMAWQHIGTQHDCEPKPDFTITGQELIGAPLKAPLAKYERVHLLPMASVKMNKGTGIVTSVPADSPDDFVNWRQLRDKPEYRAKLGIKDEWILPFELVAVTNIPGIGEFPAKVLCEEKNVDGPKHVALAECHDVAYLKSWEDGFLAVDDDKFRGHKVKVARNEVKAHLIELGQGIAYSEPDKKVVSRSGDECVVALCDQYYLKYGTDKEWQAQVRDYVNNGLNCYSEGVKKGFREVVEWFGEWPCSRNFGLGTTIPVPGGEKYLIDSLSDSTVYWAYYTLCPFLQGGAAYNGVAYSDDGSHLNLDSKKPSPAGIKPEQMTDDVWDALLLGKPEIDDLQTTIDKNILKTMRREFLYWYPIDMRGSGKDLIQNHLTMALYNHQAIFGPEMLPKSYYCNGHILVDGEKMAKSKGNFLTLKEAMEAYGTDATRIAMAEAGDSLDDANFVRDVANSLVLKLTKELDWAEEVAKFKGDLRKGEFKFFDRAFENAINKSIVQSERYYVNMQFREALRVSFHDLQKARDVYRQQVGGDKGMHQDLINRWLEVQALTMAPIAPHWSEFLWQNILGNTTHVVSQRYPKATNEVNAILELSVDYLDSVIVELRKILAKAPKKGDEKVNSGNVFVVTSYEPWQVQTIEWLKAEFAANNNALPADVAKRVPDALKKNLKEVMPFVGFLKEQVAKYGADKTFGDTPVLPESSILTEQNDYIKQQLGIQNLSIFASNDASAPDAAVRARARLQKPTAVFSHQA